MPKISEIARAFSDRFARRGRKRRQTGGPALATIERLESRLALFSPVPIQVTQIPSGSGPNNGLEILFSQGGAITADQHVVIDIDRVFPALGTPQTRVNVYASTNPAANSSQPGTAYTNIDYIRVVVPNYDVAGTNNNSFTIKGMALPSDRIIISGSGRTSAGRWSDESGSELQIAFDIEGIDDTTVIAGGVINVSGAFTNDTGDASIHAIGEVAERSKDQQTGTVIVGQTTPTPIDLPQPRLYSDYVQIIGAELDIYSTIVATHQVILRAAESAPGDARANLVLPYDITVTDTTDGVVELHSTRNITQLQSSTITARKLVAVSNNSNPIPPGTGLDGNAWNIDLGSVNNDFDEIALGMIAAPGDEPNKATQGRIGVRDIDDLTVADFGILASTGMVTLRAGGQLDINSAIQATGLTAQSNFGIASSAAGILKIGDLGITIDAANTAASATGDVALNGRITVGSGDFTKGPDTKIRSRGTTTIAGGISSPQKGTLLVEADEGIVIDAPVQFGSTQLDVNSTTATVFVGDIRLVSNGIGSAGITVRNKPGNEGVPQTLRASEGISLESTGDILVEGAVLAGSLYGNPSNLTETAALPSITVKTTGVFSLASTGALKTVAYETDPDATTNPMVGLISISSASQVNGFGLITADGALSIDVVGDVSLAGPMTGRENVVVKTSAGSIDVQGAVVSTGGTYTAAVAAGSQREPNVILSAANGSISTSNLGTLRAGTVTAAGAPTYGTVSLDAQQDIVIGADVDTDGGFTAMSKIGAFELGALLRTGVDPSIDINPAAVIKAAAGITEGEFGRIESELLEVEITSETVAADITLPSLGNRVDRFIGRNMSPGGSLDVVNDGVVNIQRLETRGDINFTSTGTISVTGLTQSLGGSITISSVGGGMNVQSTVLAPQGGVDLSATGQIVQRGGNVVTIFLLSGGRDYSYALVTIDSPPGAGDEALATATITPYPVIPGDNNRGDGVIGTITGINIVDGGWGYPSGSRVAVTLTGDGEGAAAVAETSIVTSSIEALDNITLRAGDGVTLVSAVRSSAGDVDISATLGDIVVQSITAGDAVSVNAERGKITVVSVAAGGDATLVADQGFRVTDSLSSVGGDLSITTTNGDLTFENDLVTGAGVESVLSAKGGGITLTSLNGAIVTPYTMNAKNDVTLTSFNTLAVEFEITSQTGDITATSTSGRISLAANIVAEQGSVVLEAQTALQQNTLTGVTKIELLSAGPVLDQPPVVTVTVAPPRAGGGRGTVAAAIIERRELIQQGGANPAVIAYEYFIGSIVVLDPGEGYAVDEQPLVTVTGVAGVVAQAFGPAAVQMVYAMQDITIDAGEDVTLVTKIHAVQGDVAVTSKTGDLDLSSDALLVSAKVGSIDIVADRGFAKIERMAAGANITVDALQAITIEDNLYSENGDITLTSRNDAVAARDVNAEGDIAVSGFFTSTLAGEITSRAGDISATSGSGGVFLDANVVAEQGSISLTPQTFVEQRDGTGIEAIRVVEAGSVLNAFPTVTVVIAPPRTPGGEQATAIAVIGQRAIGAGNVNQVIEYYIASIRIANPGRGYALGENPIVTITGIDGAIAEAVGPTNVRNLYAREDITITAVNDVTLLYLATAQNGDIEMFSTSGDIDVSASGNLLHAVAGSVNLEAAAGAVNAIRIKAGTDVSLVGHTGVSVARSVSAGGAIDARSVIGNVFLKGEIYSQGGDVTIRSSSSSIALAASVHADNGRIDITAHGGLFQLAGSGVQRVELLAGGESAGTTIPVVTVTLAPPKGGGITAEAFARLKAVTNSLGLTRYIIDTIEITSPGRGYEIGESPAVTIVGIDGAAAIAIGPSGYQDIVADSDIIITVGEDIILTNVLRSDAGNVSITSVDGDLSLNAIDQIVHAVAGSVKLEAAVGSIDVNRIYASADVEVRARVFVTLETEVVSEAGDIVVGSGSGSVFIAANVHAALGTVRIEAHHQVRQTSRSGLKGIEVLAGGQFVGGQSAPTVTVVVAPPKSGGVPATAVAIVVQNGFTVEQFRRPIWTLQAVLLMSPGNGYAIGERPLVTIIGMPGALAVAKGPTGTQSIVASEDIAVSAGDNVLLVDKVRSELGDITIGSISGDLDLGTPGMVVQAVQGSVTIDAAAGAIDIHRIYAGANVGVRGQGVINLDRELVAETGDIVVTSVSSAIRLTANINAIGGAIELSAHQGIVQAINSGITLVEMIDTGSFNGTAQPVVVVVIAPPSLGGTQAQAEAIVEQISATATGTPIWGVISIIVTNPGSGYSVGERALVRITGVTGAIATAIGPTGREIVVADDDLTLAAGDDVQFVGIVRSNSGDVTISTINGSFDLSETGQQVHAVAGSITLSSRTGAATLQQLTAGGDISVSTQGHMYMLNVVDSEAGDVTMTSRAGNLDFTAFAALLYAEGGSVTLSALSGSILTAPTLNVAGDVSLKSLNTIALRNEITSATGDIAVESVSGGITLAVNIHAIEGSVSLKALGTITQLERGIQSVEVLTGGSGYNAATTITIAAPVAGGVTATARPIIGANGALIGVRIVKPGSGYGVDEQPAVTITPAAGFGGTLANALAHVTQGLLNIAAGDDVTIDSLNGTILLLSVLNVVGDITLRSNGGLNVANDLTSADGSINLESRNGAITLGSDADGANLIADDRITLVARQGITQLTGFIKAKELVARNATTRGITLTNASNDVENVSILSLGAVNYTDANDFEVGVNRMDPLGVEMRGDALSLSSLAPYSTIRVVSGLQYRTLAIGAGNVNGDSVGTVEFVPTAAGDNPAAAGLTPTFAGTLRDMIRYINDNTAVYVANQTTRSQPAALVFDEAGYAVDTITVAATLPTFNRAVTFDGGRLEESVLLGGQTRLNITQGLTALPYGLSFAPAIPAARGKAPAYPGSAGSSIQHVAMYGFKKGSALVLASGNNTVTDFYAGLRADGTADATTRNLVGLDVTGVAASNNGIGSTVFDAATANRFGGNTSAGILIRNGAAGTRVYGSVIGDDTGSTPLLANGDGIRISASTGNVIGTPDATQPDQTDSVSNLIVGNSGNGVAIVNAVAGTTAAANVVRNNLISGNKVGVFLSASKFAAIGGANGESGNTIISQKGDGVAIANSTDVQILGNRIGISPTTDFVAESLAGNAGNGVSIAGTSQRVQIASGNRMSANTLNGVSIGTGATAVTITGNTIGGTLDDGSTGAGNGVDGVVITAAIGNTVGAGNLISRNGRNGVSVIDARAMALAAGNRITGSTVTGNASHGVYVSGGSGSTVGGTTVTDGNVIQANGKSGVYLEQSSKTGVPTGYAIQQNFIGTNTNRDMNSALGNLSGGIVVNDGTGVRVESNVVMNNRRANDSLYANDPNDGITVRGGRGNVIGGIAVAQGNLVANNQRDGIRIVGPTVARPADGHWVTGNTVTNNGSNGITVADGFARNIAVGQSVTSAGVRGLGNLIRQNAAFGVTVTGNAQQVSIQGNSIAANVSGGISIAAGSNTSTAAGISLTKAKIRQPMGSQLQVLLQGSLTGAVKGQQYSIDVYANSPQDSNYGGYHGRRFLGRVTVTATVDGTITWGAKNPLAISANVAVGEFITASVTALRIEPGSSSKLSAGVQATR